MAKKNLTQQELDIITRTVLGEAAGEGPEGMTAVANVINNRANSGRFSSNPAMVAIQGATGAHQFSAWDHISPQSPMVAYGPSSKEYQQARAIVQGVIAGDIPDNTGNAMFYYANQGPNAIDTPYWWRSEAANATPTQIGHQIFASQTVARPLPAPGPLEPIGTLAAGGTVLSAVGSTGEANLRTGSGLITRHVSLVPIDTNGNPVLDSPFTQHINTAGTESNNIEDTRLQSASDKLIDAGQAYLPNGAAARAGYNAGSWAMARARAGIVPPAKVTINDSNFNTPPPSEFQANNLKAVQDVFGNIVNFGAAFGSNVSKGVQSLENTLSWGHSNNNNNPAPRLTASGTATAEPEAVQIAADVHLDPRLQANMESWQRAQGAVYIAQPDKAVTVYRSVPNPAYRTKIGGDTQDHHAITNIQGVAPEEPPYITVPQTYYVKQPPKLVTPQIGPIAATPKLVAPGAVYNPNNPSNFTAASEASHGGSYTISNGMLLPTTTVDGQKRNTYGDETLQGGLFQSQHTGSFN